MNLLNEITELERQEVDLLIKINIILSDYCTNPENLKFDVVDLSNLNLRHRIHDRPISYMKSEFGDVYFYSGKGYCIKVRELPMDDIKIILKSLKPFQAMYV